MSSIDPGCPAARQLPEQSDKLAGGAPSIDGELTEWNGHAYKTRVFPVDEGRVIVEVTLIDECQEAPLWRLDMTAYDGPGYIDAARQWLISEIEADLYWQEKQS